MTDFNASIAIAVQLLNIIAGIFMFVLGSVGNLLTIYVFTRVKFRNTSSARYLIANAVANFIQILQTLLTRVIINGFSISIGESSNGYCKVRNYIAGVVTLCSLSYLCWASFDHFVSTSRNATTRSNWTSKTFVYCAIFATILVWLIVYLPVVVFYEVNDGTCLLNNFIVNYIYSYGVVPLGYAILPTMAIVCFNEGIIRNLTGSRVIGLNQVNRRLTRQIQRMLLPQLIILLLSSVPFSIEVIYSLATASMLKDAKRLAVENLISTIVRLLFYLNYFCSFYIYSMMSSEFRKELKILVSPRTQVSPATITMRTTVVNQNRFVQ